MSKKHMVMSPTFSGFRAGEPAAFALAKRLFKKWDGRTEGVFEGCKYVYDEDKDNPMESGIVSIYLDNRPPFKFHVEVF